MYLHIYSTLAYKNLNFRFYIKFEFTYTYYIIINVYTKWFLKIYCSTDNFQDNTQLKYYNPKITFNYKYVLLLILIIIAKSLTL